MRQRIFTLAIATLLLLPVATQAGLNATVLSILVIGHIGAGLYHHFIKKDTVLRRMLPFGRVDSA